MKTWITRNGYTIRQILSGRSNVFILTGGIKTILVDTGPSRKKNTLYRRLIKKGVNHIDLLILTHSHFDHADNAAMIKEKFNADVLIHKSEAQALAAGLNIIPEGTIFLTRILVKLLKKIVIPRMHLNSCQPDIFADENYDLKPYGYNAYIMHTPGHTQGSVCVIVDDEIVLAGDTLYSVFKGSAFPPFANNVFQLLESWRKLLETPCNIFIPSHGTARNREVLSRNYMKRIHLSLKSGDTSIFT
jgi:hydroxyacylglutathione hydrolase